MVIDELQKLINAYNKIAQEKKDRHVILQNLNLPLDMAWTYKETDHICKMEWDKRKIDH